MTMLEELSGLGCNVNEGISRLMNNESFYIKFLKKLPDSIAQNEVLSFIEAGDNEKARINAHTLKGVTGNLSITPLYNAYFSIDAAFKAGDFNAAKELYLKIMPLQQQIIDIIQKY